MGDRKFFVEVCTQTPSGAYITREPTTDWNNTLKVARDIVGSMFYDDPMAQRVFHNGLLFYQGKNDFGDEVIVRPICRLGEEEMKVVSCPAQPACETKKIWPKCREGVQDGGSRV